jgi:hypothetical protein
VRYLVLAAAAMVAGCAGTAPREEIPREAGGLRSGDEVELFGEDEVCMWSDRPTRLLFPAGTHASVIGPGDGDPRPDRLVRVQVSEHYPGSLDLDRQLPPRPAQLKLVRRRSREDMPANTGQPEEIHIDLR